MFKPLLSVSQLESLDVEKYKNVVIELSHIDRDNIDDDIANVPAIFSYYYGLMIRSKKILDDSKIALEFQKAKLGVSFKEEGAKITATHLENLVLSNDGILSNIQEVSRNEEVYNYMKGICSTLEQRKDMLIQLSANKRQEIKLHN